MEIRFIRLLGIFCLILGIRSLSLSQNEETQNFINIEQHQNKFQANLDSFEILKNDLEYKYSLDYEEFDSLLVNLSKFGDIHNFVIERIDETRRTEMHDYYPAFFFFVTKNMDLKYQRGIIEKIVNDSIDGTHAYYLVKNYLFESQTESCEFLNNLKLEEVLNHNNSRLYENLLKLKEEMKCSM